ncbi:ABC transporter ATP-binding protein [uncultured Arcticibacterium sp.]|uniref:ABC transporter ATP-binding protein n=1 Tax=uncultured Arcticibacterium sp. TaxID=2173042 RepID=UPI0030FC4A34
MLKAEGVFKKYGELEVLKGIDLEIKSGEIVAIVGPSGAGKTTLLQILGTLDVSDLGKIFLDNMEVSSLSEKQIVKLRNEQLGFVFQFHNLMAELTALENVCLPGWIGKRSEKEVKERAIELLTTLGLKDREEHLPSELSGGEQQRVAVARALINSPKIIFADEPTGNLDTQNALDLHNLLLDIREKFNCAFVIVTHNKELAEMADRVITLKDGRVV